MKEVYASTREIATSIYTALALKRDPFRAGLSRMIHYRQYPWTVEKEMDFIFDLIRSTNLAESIICRNLVVSAKFNHKFVIAYAYFS